MIKVLKRKSNIFLSILLIFGLASVTYANTNQNLIEAAKNGNVKKVKTFLAHGADINVKDKDGKTALIWAAYKGHRNVVKLLLAHGADINVKDKDGKTALIWAIYKDHPYIVMLIKQARAKE
jgi:ankyrin repeat protein